MLSWNHKRVSVVLKMNCCSVSILWFVNELWIRNTQHVITRQASDNNVKKVSMTCLSLPSFPTLTVIIFLKVNCLSLAQERLGRRAWGWEGRPWVAASCPFQYSFLHSFETSPRILWDLLGVNPNWCFLVLVVNLLLGVLSFLWWCWRNNDAWRGGGRHSRWQCVWWGVSGGWVRWVVVRVVRCLSGWGLGRLGEHPWVTRGRVLVRVIDVVVSCGGVIVGVVDGDNATTVYSDMRWIYCSGSSSSSSSNNSSCGGCSGDGGAVLW